MSATRRVPGTTASAWLKRLKRAARLGVFVLIVLLAFSAAVWWYFDIKWGRDLKAEMAALKDEGIPVRLEDIMPRPVPEEQNAATLYQKVFRVRFTRLKIDDVSFSRSVYASGMAGLSPDELGILKQYVQAPESGDFAQCRRLLRRPQVQAALDIFERASRRAECIFPVRWQDSYLIVFPHLRKAQSAAEIVAAWALLLASEERTEEALDWCKTGLRMCRHFASEPSPVAQHRTYKMWRVISGVLSRIVCDWDVPPTEAGRLGEPLRALDTVQKAACPATLRQAIPSMGVCYEDLHQRPASAYDIVGALAPWSFGQDEGPLLVGQIAARIYCSRLARPLHKLDHLRFLRWMHAMVSLSKLPHRESAAAHQSLDEELITAGGLPRWIPMFLTVRLPMPFTIMIASSQAGSYVDLTSKRDIMSAEIGLWRVALALKAHKHEHGSYPAYLGTLQSSLQEPLPEDPFSGDRFRYRRQGEGFTVYSLGPDLTDNGGSEEIESGAGLDTRGDIIRTCTK